MGRIVLQASPRADQSGLAVAVGPESTLLLSILPKLWRSGRQGRIEVVWRPEEPLLQVRMFEGDVLDVSASGEYLESVQTLLLRSRVRKDVDSSPFLVELPSSAVANYERVEPDRGLGNWWDLLTLSQRARIRKLAVDLPAVDEAEPPVFRALLQARFLDEVQLQLRFIRRGYAEVDEALPAVRGRILEHSLGVSVAERSTRLFCRYDELSETTPLLRVLATALATVARPADRLTSLLGSMLGSNVSRAVHLLRQLSTVPQLPRARAAILGRRIRLEHLDRRWGNALNLAVQVLEDAGVEIMKPRLRGFPAFEVRIRTWRIWEDVLEQVLRRAFAGATVLRASENRLPEGLTVPAPWRIVSSTGDVAVDQYVYPDFALLDPASGDCWCCDAKYKFFPASGLDGTDLYHMFAYSHLARVASKSDAERAIDKCALLYPLQSGEQPRFLEMRRERSEQGNVTLSAVTVPFPLPSDCSSSENWNSYIEAGAAGARSFIAGKTSP